MRFRDSEAQSLRLLTQSHLGHIKNDFSAFRKREKQKMGFSVFIKVTDSLVLMVCKTTAFFTLIA